MRSRRETKSTASPDHVDKYNMRNLRNQDKITLNLIDSCDYPPVEIRFRNSLTAMLMLASNGGTKFDGKPVTYRDPTNLIFTLKIVAEYADKDVSTTFVVFREDVYFSAFSLDDGITWKNCSGSRVHLVGCKIEPLHVSYPSDSHHNSEVGLNVILRSLHDLHNGTDYKKQSGFHRIAVHFSESLRNNRIAQIVERSLKNYVIEPLDDLSIIIIQNWDTMSSWVRLEVLEEREVSLAVVSKLGGDTIKDWANIKNDISLLLKEKESDREIRRQKVRKDNHTVDRGKHKIDRIQLRKRNLENRRNELDVGREQILNELITSGGYADIWRCLIRCLREADDLISMSIIRHTDVNVMQPDLSQSYDDKDFLYQIPDELV